MIVPPTTEQLREMSAAPCPYWHNHTNPPATPASQEHTMDMQYAANAAATTRINPSLAVTASDCPVTPPVVQALNDLSNQIGECRYSADALIEAISPALSSVKPADTAEPARPAMASELAETIQQMADAVRATRLRITDARERLTL